MTTSDSDTGYAPLEWAFDEEVTRVFDNMLERSIPAYRDMRRLVKAIGMPFASDGGMVVDIGCSLGESFMPFVGAAEDIVAFESSAPMFNKVADRVRGLLPSKTHIELVHRDVTAGLQINQGAVDLALSVLTTMFIPMDKRTALFSEIYASLRPGGAFIVVEKVKGEGAINQLMVDEYHKLKIENGYTKEQVDVKAQSLVGVLVPAEAKETEMMMREAGFSQVDCFWRWMNFAGWVALR